MQDQTNFRDEGEGNEVSSPQVIDLPPISTYLPEEHNIERPELRSLLHNSQAMGSLEKLIRSVHQFPFSRGFALMNGRESCADVDSSPVPIW
ncbi:unnamed protein product [Cylicostephanus goldi]|uniref:Uncharacterized protein n=1 Tax=Cylicostephanus goldi TaxID=71465 RepID=A0A3P6RX85_CYLGO|nr:unnamed protein product [Cylicostephanus goldi]